MTDLTIHWIELRGQAHIVRQDRYLDSALCGASLAEATMVAPGDDLDGCLDCIEAYAAKHTEHRPEAPAEPDKWG